MAKKSENKAIKKSKNAPVKVFGLGNLSPALGSRRPKKRVGRGTSSGHGKTCGRGHKGQKSRSGGVKRPGFEGGQTPLYRRLPKLNRFKNYLFKKEFSIVNLSDLAAFEGDVNTEKLVNAGLVSETGKIKVLGDGELKKPLNVSVHAFSESAKKKIEAAGGKAIKL
jgi:large subunit ribosomal protein L15